MNNSFVIDCAIVPNLNEDMIVTANVANRLMQHECNPNIACDVIMNNDIVNKVDDNHDEIVSYCNDHVNVTVSNADTVVNVSNDGDSSHVADSSINDDVVNDH